jgi:DNA-binding CsgD family transcriptional regulator
MSDEFYRKLQNAVGLDELADEFEYALKKFGFAGFVYWTHLRKPFESLVGSDVYMLSRSPAHLKAFEELYFSRNFKKDDPLLRAAAKFDRPFTTEEARSGDEPNRRRRWLYSLEKRFRFKYDINLPVHTQLRCQVINAYCIGGEPDTPRKIAAATPEVAHMARAFAASIIDFVFLEGEDETAHVKLTRRQQGCLTWMAKGRANDEIADIFGVSERRVKFHFAELSKRLNAANRTEAVAIAVRQGWITN